MMKNMFFMRLNTAAVVIGWLGMLGSFVMTILLSAILGYSDVIAKDIVEKLKETEPSAYDEIHMGESILSTCTYVYVFIKLNRFCYFSSCRDLQCLLGHHRT